MESNIQGKSFLKEVLTFPKLGTVLRSHHIAKSTTEQCGGSSSDWMKFCSSVSGKLKALKVVQLKEEEMLEKQVPRLHQTLPSTAPGVLQVQGYSLKLESAT